MKVLIGMILTKINWGHYERKYDDDGNILSEKWIPNIVTIKENAGFSEYIAWEWSKFSQNEEHSKSGLDLINFVNKTNTSDTYGWGRDAQLIEQDMKGINEYLKSKGISKSDPDFVHLSDFISAISYDSNLGSLVTGGHSYDYWTKGDENRVTEITAGYNVLKSIGREDLINIEKDLAPNLMEMIEKEWSKIW